MSDATADPVRRTETRIEVDRLVDASPQRVFAVLTDPQGHVAIDASGMLQGADGEVVSAPGDEFVVHMDREALGDLPDYGTYDVRVVITDLEPDRLIVWTIVGRMDPPVGHTYGYRLTPARTGEATLVTSFYDWSDMHESYRGTGIMPVLGPEQLRGTLGILDRTVRRGYVRG